VKIRFSEFGSTLGTRHLGRIVKLELDRLFNGSEEKLEFDFLDVTLVTNSFADEVFGKKVAEVGLNEFKQRTTFTNLTPFIGMCIKKAIENRVKEAELIK